MKFSNEVSIVLSGAAGQGLKTVEKLLMHILNNSGYNIFYLKNICPGSGAATIPSG